MSKDSFTTISNAIIDKHIKKLKGAALSVYMVLRRRSDIQGKKVWPGVDVLATDTGYSERQIKRAIKILVELKIIFKEMVMTPQGRQKNVYHFLSQCDMGVMGGVTPVSYDVGHGSPHNNTNINNTNKTTTTPTPKIVKETIVREYETHSLDDVVVAILKNFKVDPSFWPSLNGMDTNRVEALAGLAKKKAKSNPGGWFRRAVEGGWDIPGYDKRAFEMQCDMIRGTSTHLVSKKTGSQYEIDRYKTGDKIVIHTGDRGDVVITCEKELGDFTWHSNK